MENVKTFAEDLVVVNDSLIVEKGGAIGKTAIGDKGAVSVYGTATENNIFNGGYMGVGVEGTADWTQVFAGAEFAIWENAAANNTSVLAGGVLNAWGGTINNTGVAGYVGVGKDAVAANTFIIDDGAMNVWGTAWGGIVDGGSINVFNNGDLVNFTIQGTNQVSNVNLAAGAESYGATVNVGGNLHVAGDAATYVPAIAYDTTVNGGYVGVSMGVIDDTIIWAGKVDLFVGGTADEINVRGGELNVGSFGVASDVEIRGGIVTVFAEGFAESVEIGFGQLIVAGMGGAKDVEVNDRLTLYAGANLAGEIDIDGGSINTFGKVFAKDAVINVEADVLTQISKVVIDDLAAIEAGALSIEVNSLIAEGRYLIAGNAAAFNGVEILVEDSNLTYTAVIGGYGQYMTDGRTYRFAIDANDNLYMDVIEGFTAEYQTSNTLGAGWFGAFGVQQVWTNDDKSAVAIAGMGTYAAAGEFAGIGDFNGDGIDDILFANGNDLTAVYLTNADLDNDGMMDSVSHTYAGLLTNGSMDDFQIEDFAFGNNSALYIKRAEGFYDKVALVNDTATIVDSTTCIA